MLKSKDNIVPIEVNSNNGNAKSMKTLIESDKYPEIEFGIKLANKNVGFNDIFYTFPYFLSFKIKDFLRKK